MLRATLLVGLSRQRWSEKMFMLKLIIYQLLLFYQVNNRMSTQRKNTSYILCFLPTNCTVTVKFFFLGVYIVNDFLGKRGNNENFFG